MARLPRLALAGHLHHVVQRGHRGQDVFGDDDDRRAFLEALFEIAAAEGLAVHGYGLPANEVQYLATPKADGTLSRVMQSLGRRYGARFNRRHGLAGSLWSGRFRSSIVEPERWALPCLRQVELAGMAADPASDLHSVRWSSAAHHLGKAVIPGLRELAAYWSLGNTPFEREAKWAQFLQGPVDSGERDAIRGAVDRGWLLGSEPFVQQTAKLTSRRLVPGKPGRPIKLSPKK